MDDSEKEADRAALISRLFALLTAKFEDAAGIAADCQGRLSAEDLLAGARRVLSLAEEAATLAAATAALIERPGPTGSAH